MDRQEIHELAEARRQHRPYKAMPKARQDKAITVLENYLLETSLTETTPKPQPAAKSFASFFHMSESVAKLASEGREQ